MKITLTNEEGKAIQVTISDEEYAKLFPQKKKTGYERVKNKEKFYFSGVNGKACRVVENSSEAHQEIYEGTDYYSDKTVAENNARADKLMRQLRRFAVEHREKEPNWANKYAEKFHIFYDHEDKEIHVNEYYITQGFGTIYFDTNENAKLAIDTFRDELLWYFTEYRDSL